MLKLLLQVILGLLGAAVIVTASSYIYFFLVLPRDLPAPELNVERTPERLARGEYLANAVLGCVYCHSDRDWTLFGAPPKPGTIGVGGQIFDQSLGLPGMVVAPNITPYHLRDWSDGELYRAIVNGLHKEGYAFFPIMPFDVYLHLETEDVYSIITYLRSLDSIANETPQRKPGSFMQLIGNIRALPADPWITDKSNPVARGKYLAVIAGCEFCHTPTDNHAQAIPGMRLAGGLGMPTAGVTVYSANITPDKLTGIGTWTRQGFIRRFKGFAGMRVAADSIGFNTQHAWTEYARMSPDDLGDIYSYLMAQPAVHNKIDPLEGSQP